MSTKLKNKFWMLTTIPTLAIQLFATSAGAVEAKWSILNPLANSPFGTKGYTATGDQEDMSASDLKDSVMGFGTDVSEGKNGEPYFSVRGKVFTECADNHLQVKKDQSTGLNGETRTFVRFIDPNGEMRGCMQQMIKTGWSCSNDRAHCKSLMSYMPNGTGIDLTESDNGEVLLSVNGSLVPFSERAIYKDNMERITQGENKRKAEAARLHAPEVDRLQAILTDCPTNADGITRQRRALEKLSRIDGVLDSGEWTEIKHEIDKNELKVLSDLARTAPVDELADIQRRLTEVERLDNNVAASVYVQIAENYARSTEKHSLRQAVSSIKQARTMGGLTPHNQTQLDNLYFDYRIKELREYAGSGTLSAGLYQREFIKLAAELEKRRQETCGRGVRASGDACSGVTAEIEDMRQVPQDAQQGWQNRMQMQMYRGPSSVASPLQLSPAPMFGRVLWW